jgi:hypothetical protein
LPRARYVSLETDAEQSKEIVAQIDKLMAQHVERMLHSLAPTIEAAVRASVSEEIRNVILGPILDNYQGYVCATLRCGDQEVSQSHCIVGVGMQCALDVWFQSEEPREGVVDSVDIFDGKDSSSARFDVRVNSKTFGLHTELMTFDVGASERSSVQTVEFSAPQEIGEHDIWVEVYQKNRPIQVLSLRIEVRRDPGPTSHGGEP